ncbi:type 2 lanthipeptide synthetase LanM family protein [Micromonospora sp. NPDC000207]|uniref:type 2 lanthipeptide synthetase LanM family protein n=1 Tax=Micromonospora sp. NPDC000207 TaxID=3154246 RepID=UPI00332CBDAC
MSPTTADTTRSRAPHGPELLAADWWAGALALHERVGPQTGRWGDPDADGDRLTVARQRLARWRTDHGPRLAPRLHELDLDEDRLVAILAEPRSALAARVRRPDWVDVVESAVRAAEPLHPDADVPADWRAAFALPLRPLLDQATARLRAGAPGGDVVDTATLTAALADRLGRRLAGTSARALVAELHRQRTAGLLVGDDGRARFVDFVRRSCTPTGLADLVTRHPVLARWWGQAAMQAADVLRELVTRYAADRPDLVGTLLDGVDPGPLVAVEDRRGDSHRGGRSTSVVRFADGRRLVYKPRDLTPDVRLRVFVDWLNTAVPAVGLRTADCLPRTGYGWTEYVSAAPLADSDAAGRFYRRQGLLLALAHALDTTDLHYENLIASGEYPVLVDAETLFHPGWGDPVDSGDPAADLLAASVYRTALLPMIVVGDQGIMDLSGVGGDGGRQSPTSRVEWAEAGTDRMRLVRRAGTFDGALNQPRIGDRVARPEEHEADFLHGFRLGYAAIEADRDTFGRLVEESASATVRLVVRPTWSYRTLLDEATHPDLLRDGLDTDRAYGVLWGRTGGHGDPVFARHEVTALWRGDVPYFTASVGGLWLTGQDGERTGLRLRRRGVDGALDRIAGFGESDRQDQEWVISACLATRRPVAGHHDAVVSSGPPPGTAAPPPRLLAAACAVADQLVARGVPGRGRVNWLGLELVDDRQWLLLPMGAGLANGYLGVALFLGELARLSGVPRYGEVARRAVGATGPLLDLLAQRPELVRAVGCGALHGLGGVAYGLARLSTLLDDGQLREWTGTAVELAATVVTPADGGVDWATGQAGCLAAMASVHAELGLDRAGSVARACADQLADLTVTDTGAPAATGFADGAAGVAFALHRYVASGAGTDRHAAAAEAALTRAVGTAPASSGWCGGAAGLALAVAASTLDPASTAPDVPGGGNPTDLDGLVRRLAERPFTDDLSLCHGESGVVEALTVLAAGPAGAAAGAAAGRARRRRAALVLDALGWPGRVCGTPGGVPTPGLLTGLAGIGYGLLRSGLAEQVPSALLLEPTSRPIEPGRPPPPGTTTPMD